MKDFGDSRARSCSSSLGCCFQHHNFSSLLCCLSIKSNADYSRSYHHQSTSFCAPLCIPAANVLTQPLHNDPNVKTDNNAVAIVAEAPNRSCEPVFTEKFEALEKTRPLCDPSFVGVKFETVFGDVTDVQKLQHTRARCTGNEGEYHAVALYWIISVEPNGEFFVSMAPHCCWNLHCK